MVFIFACASSKQVATDDVDRKKSSDSRYDESFDPLSLDDEDIVITKKENVDKVKNNSDSENKNNSIENIEMREVEGYRVQLMATRSIETATMAQQRALDTFTALEYKVYLIFEAPLYRIRLGDATNRTAAELIREAAKARGYDEAFIVRSKVVVPANQGIMPE
jgi:hypothetical protein